jgi:hypothetical protein
MLHRRSQQFEFSSPEFSSPEFSKLELFQSSMKTSRPPSIAIPDLMK